MQDIALLGEIQYRDMLALVWQYEFVSGIFSKNLLETALSNLSRISYETGLKMLLTAPIHATTRF